MEVPQLRVDDCWRSSSTVVNVPVTMQRRCLFNSRGASDSVHRQSRGHLVVQQRPVRSFYQRRYGGGDWVF